jgi:hypothetical protein
MVAPLDVLVYLGFLVTPLVGSVVQQLLVRTGWFTDSERGSPPSRSRATGERVAYKSRAHRLAVLGGFFVGWVGAVGVYGYVLATVYLPR